MNEAGPSPGAAGPVAGPGPDKPQQFWRGNLPCCTDDRSGCASHNPNRQPVFYDANLPAHAKSAGTGFFKAIKDTAAKAHSAISGGTSGAMMPQQHPAPEIWCSLPRVPETWELLPQVHPSVHYSLSFYHVHTVMSAVRNGQDPAPFLAALTCRGKSGTWPSITYAITPKVVASASSTNDATTTTPTHAFLIEHFYTFTMSLKHATGAAFYATARTPFLAEGYRNFAPCRHFVRLFRQVREERRKQQYFAAVDYSLKNVLGQEFRDVWRSDVGRQPTNMCCGMCFTDSSLEFEVVGDKVVVRFLSHRDLGEGVTPEDGKWVAGVKGKVQRSKEDFGRIRGAFSE